MIISILADNKSLTPWLLERGTIDALFHGLPSIFTTPDRNGCTYLAQGKILPFAFKLPKRQMVTSDPLSE
jgi:hypothetical protein